MDTITQLKKMIDDIEFSDRVKDKIKELSIGAQLRRESGKEEKDCLTAEEKETLMDLIKADMILDAVEIRTHQASLKAIDKVLAGLKK